MSQPVITTHILKLSCGIKVIGQLDETTGQFGCGWDRPRPWSKELLKKVQQEYSPWRNRLLQDWVNRNGKSLLVIDYSSSQDASLIYTTLLPQDFNVSL